MIFFIPCPRASSDHLVVRVGEYDLLEVDPGQTDLTVRTIIVHPDYNPETVSADICLIELEDTADLESPYVDTLELPRDGEEYIEGSPCVVIGWGSLVEGGYISMVLQKVEVPIVSDDRCQEEYEGLEIIEDSKICAGLEEGGKDSCQVRVEEILELIGIQSAVF